MARELKVHPVAALFPDLPEADFAALVEDIRVHGVKVPILVHNGQILDGRHRYNACRQLRKPCPSIGWNGRDPWLEAQSRNLLRRHLSKEQIYAIRILAVAQFPSLAAPIQAARDRAKQRKAQAKGHPRGVKVLSRSDDHPKESADVIGALLGVSGATVKRVDRVARLAPALLPQVAAGTLSASKALQSAEVKTPRVGSYAVADTTTSSPVFAASAAARRLRSLIKAEWRAWPRHYRTQFLRALQLEMHELVYEHTVITPRSSSAGLEAAIGHNELRA